jgi:hypothetical protein
MSESVLIEAEWFELFDGAYRDISDETRMSGVSMEIGEPKGERPDESETQPSERSENKSEIHCWACCCWMAQA